MESHPFHEMSAGLRLEGRYRRVAQLGVGLPIAVGNALQQLLIELQ